MADDLDIRIAALWWSMLTKLGAGDFQAGQYKLFNEWYSLQPDASSGRNKRLRDPEAFDRLMDRICEEIDAESPWIAGPVGAHGFIQAVLMDASLSSSMALNAYSLAGWYEYALPTIEVGHKLAASLLVTSATPSILEDVRAPFPSFVIHIPPELIVVRSAVEDKLEPIRDIVVSHLLSSDRQPHWAFVAKTYSKTWIWANHKTLTELVHDEDCGDFSLPLDAMMHDVDLRANFLCKRLIVNVMLMMTEREHVETVGKGHTASRRRNPGTPPQRRIFRLTAPVRHDFREAVAGFMHGDHRKLNLQHIVGGHWKLQAHGPRSELRKRIFVEPYWRGPEDAPIALRPHRMEAE